MNNIYTIAVGVLNERGCGDYNEIYSTSNLEDAKRKFEELKKDEKMLSGWSVPVHGYVELTLQDADEALATGEVIDSYILVDKRQKEKR